MTTTDVANRAADATVFILGGVVLGITALRAAMRWARYQATR